MFDSNKWSLNEYNKDIVESLSKELNISRVCSVLLYNRNIRTYDSAVKFLDKTESHFYNPFLLDNMKEAVDRILISIRNKEKITIYGDYDADGITSVSILYIYLKSLGLDVDYYIPSREFDGYGVNIDALNSIKQSKTDLIITVDTGSTAEAEFKEAHKWGIDIIVTDHHECPDYIEGTVAFINPCKTIDNYPFKSLAGVGVTFKLICALELAIKNNYNYDTVIIKDISKRFLDIVAIGTIADVMTIVDENRTIVYIGLKLLSNTHNIGLISLLKALRLYKTQIHSQTISFNLAPKINACGRMGKETLSLQLLISNNEAEAERIVNSMIELNSQRQDIEKEIYEQAVQIIEDNKLYNDKIIVVEKYNWHIGVIGIVASKIEELYNKPVILITITDNNIGRGSARSISGVNIYDLLSKSSDYLIQFGGHEGAAGLSIDSNKIDDFRIYINSISIDVTNKIECYKQYNIDCELYENEINLDTLNSFEKLEPFGLNNEVPLFIIKEAKILDLQLVSFGKHTKLKLLYKNSIINAMFYKVNLDIIGFKIGDIIDCIFNLSFNSYTNSVDLVLRDIDYSRELKQILVEFNDYYNDVINNNKEINENMFPTRDDFAEIFINLKNILDSNKKTITIKKLISEVNLENYVRTALVLSVFEELKLIQIERINKNEMAVKINDGKKVNLLDSKILKSIKVI